MVFQCAGCHEYFPRRGSYLQHLHKSSDPRCQHERDSLNNLVHRPIRRNAPCYHSTMTSTRTTPDSDVISDPQPFGGDYFGDDYGEEDFPFVNDEEPVHVDVHHDASVAEEDENVPASDNEDIEGHKESLPSDSPPVTIEYFGGEAGAPLDNMPQLKRSEYTNYSAAVEGSAENPWAPFNSQMDWEVAHWAKVHEALGLSYKNSVELNKIIDTKIPSRRPAFTHHEACVAGEMYDIFSRDILECVRALYGDPEHAQYLSFTPERHYTDAGKTQCLYHDMCTGEWWWATPEVLEQSKPGAMIIPIIISSDKTQITLFRNKTAYPPLKLAGVDGIVMMSGDSIMQHCHPIFAAFIGDYPEQCLVTGTMNGDCPICTSCNSVRIKPLQHPFWEDLPYLNIFQSITPDILHQLYQGIMKHMISWKGITTLSRVSGTEHKQMLRFLLSLVIDVRLPGNASPARLVHATRSLLDFLYLAQFPVHSDSSIDALETALDEFHANKGVFEDLGICSNFNIPKLHFLQHYAELIKLFGTTDNFNTEATERLHIDFAKDAYAATNPPDPVMTKWLERKEKVLQHANFVVWRHNLSTTDTTNIIAVSPAEHWQPPDLACLFRIKMTRHPSRKSVPFREITSLSSHGATHFIPALARFIVQYNHPGLSFQQIEDRAVNIHLPCDSVPVFHRIKFWNDEIHATETLDSIHAQPAVKNRKGRVVKAARFDTCLIQVRAVFTVPQTVLKRYFDPQNPPPQHLAYVEWFSAFSALPDPQSGLYKVRRVVRDGERQVSIVPVSLICRSAHLLPKWGGAVPAEWTSLDVLDACPSFLLNVFKDMYTYFNVG
ncbi:hypothetical protein BDR05DRAFT_978791 [Suillus weaverae]|nr:hypothetical protein BDR05DRAFT_978791 [Suillus weaverae]